MSILKRRCVIAWLLHLVLAGLLVPATAFADYFFVDSTTDAVDAAPGDFLCADANGNCTLRAAVMEANALAGADTIKLGANTYRLTLPGNAEHAAASGDLDILGPVTIEGLNPVSTIIDGGGIDRIFEIIDAGNVTLTQLTVRNGVAGFNTPGYFVNFAGGGIFNVGSSSSVTLDEVEVHNNNAVTGGGIFTMFSTMTVNQSTVFGNFATAGSGGGIVEGLAGFLNIYNSTISGNMATLHGGGLVTSNNAPILNNVTLTNNVADSDNDGNGDGGGIQQGIAAPRLSNTLLAGNFDSGGEAPDCTGGITSLGYNLIGNDTGCSITASSGDQIGNNASPLDPLLGPLGDNGSSTLTHMLLNGSMALDSGNPALPGTGGGACESLDQRNIDRTLLAPCDTGAVEQTPSQGMDFTVNSLVDQVDAVIGDGLCETAPGNMVCTLRAAVQESNALPGRDRIILPAGHYMLTLPGITENASATGDLDISDDLDITGADSASTRIDANNIDRVFETSGSSDFSISGVTIENGSAPGGQNGGGIFHQSSGILTASECVIADNTAASGGGIFTVAFNRIVVDNCVIDNNTATTYGGGIANFTFSIATISNSTLSGNSAQVGGGLMNSFLSSATILSSTISDNQANYGGGISTYFGSGQVTMTNSTVSGNRATLNGGGINVSSSDTVKLRNTTVTNNRAMGMADGGGIASGGTVTLRNSIVAANMDDGGEAPDCSGVLTSEGYNLIGNDAACTLSTSTGDLIGDNITPIDPLLGALTDLGGPTLSHALLSGSPALNAGNGAVPGSSGSSCETVDQRGVDRLLNTPCDMGAVESILADLSASVSDSEDPVLSGGALDYTVNISNAGPDTANSLVLTSTLPSDTGFVAASGGGWNCIPAAGLITCSKASLAPGASSTLTISINAPSDSGTFSHSISVSAATTDLDTENNSSSESTTVNAAPLVSTSASTSYILGGVPIFIAPDAVVSDADDTHLVSASVQISSGFVAGEDELRFTDTSTISGNWNSVTGLLSLNGLDTLAAYQTALQSIGYANIGAAPVTGTRNFNYQVSDGDAVSPVTTSAMIISLPSGSTGSTVSTPPPPIADPPGTEITLEESGEPVDAPEYDEGPTEQSEDASTTNTSDITSSPQTSDSQPATRTQYSFQAPPRAGGSPLNIADTDQEKATQGRQSPPATPGDEHYTYLATLTGSKALWTQLDSMKQQMNMAAEAESEQEKIMIGTAKGVSLFLFAGAVNWYLKAGSLLASLLSSVPLWAPFDPLPILSLSRQERDRRRSEAEKQKRLEDRDQHPVGSLLDEQGDNPETSEIEDER